jgi:YegS/Rv2252/BmrU family lipid kinase
MVPSPSNGDQPNERRRLILNPTSGRGEHVGRAREFAAQNWFELIETRYGGHATELAKTAVSDGVDLLGVCGGDGTLHEVVCGLFEADALDDVTLAVIPAGTENIVAEAFGIESLAEGFDVADAGETQRIDLGVADEEPFVMSVIAGLPADASAAATHDLKSKFGSLAFVIGGVQEALSFDGVRVAVEAEANGDHVTWRGEALSVLVGNVRKFRKEGGQADVEDGLFEVTIVERMPPSDAVAETVAQRLLKQDTEHVTELRASSVSIEHLDSEAVTFSLDGETRTFDAVDLWIAPGALRIRVGDGYDTPHETR